MINKSLLIPYKELSLGEQIHINHDGCIAGLDTKKRLYIKKVAGGVVAYCHHCNEHGFLRELTTDGTTLRKWLYNKDSKDDFARVEIDDITKYPLYSIKSPDILFWLNKHYIEGTTLSDAYYRETISGNLAMKLYPWDSISPHGIQIRNFKTIGPKYRTTLSGINDVAWFHGNTEKLFITEDYTSAYRIKQDTPYSSMALLRTSITPQTIEQLRRIAPDKIIVWLDPDEPGRKASRKLTDRLRYSLTTDVNEFLDDSEPKEHFPEILRSLCDGL